MKLDSTVQHLKVADVVVLYVYSPTHPTKKRALQGQQTVGRDIRCHFLSVLCRHGVSFSSSLFLVSFLFQGIE